MGFRGRPAGRLFRLLLVPIKPAHDISPNGPRRNPRGLRFLAFAVRLFVDRADEFAFDEDVSALLDGCSNALCELRTEHADAVPLGFRGPLVLRIFPRALCGDRKHGELRTVAFRSTLLRVRTNKPDESYRVDYVE